MRVTNLVTLYVVPIRRVEPMRTNIKMIKNLETPMGQKDTDIANILRVLYVKTYTDSSP